MSLFPVLARADSSGAEYTDAPPSATGEQPKSEHSGTPNGSNSAGGGSAGQTGNGTGAGGSGDESEESKGGVAGGKGGKGPGANGKAGVGSGEELGSQPVAHQSTKAEADEGGGGSSPLIPILIAVAVLAAISLGVLIMRQRRQDGSSVSPEAG